MKNNQAAQEKMVEIQFLRLVAVFAVIVFHFTARRASELPYGNWVSGEPWSLGWLGVELFFIVSGFVIAFSMGKTVSAKVFLINRATRLYPALVLLLPIVYLVQRFTPYSPYVDRSTPQNLFGSITLIPPTVLNYFSDQSFDWLTLVLWSLKVEVFFYLLCSLIFFVIGRDKVTAFVTSLCLLFNSILLVNEYLENQVIEWGTRTVKVFGFDNLSWFVIGMLMYSLRFNKKSKKPKLALTLVSASTLINLFLLNESDVGILIAGAAVIIIALWFGLFNMVKKFKFEKCILCIGDSSYELYLVHQGVGLTFLLFLVKSFNLGPIMGAFLGLGIVALVTFLCHLIFSRITRPINIRIRAAILRNW